MRRKKADPERLDVRGMDYAPKNELGVVFLFALLAPSLGFKGIERIQPGFPDAVARRRVSGGEERVQIEFEYRSSSYKAHKHSRRKNVTIVCWKDDWVDRPANIGVIELRREVGMGFDVWIQPVWQEYWRELDSYKRVSWSVPSLSKPGDLVVFYRVRPSMHIMDIYIQTSSTRPDAKWKHRADCKRVCQLKHPVHIDHLKADPILRTSGFMRGRFQGRRNITADWPLLHRLITKLNPAAVKPLSKFAPSFL